jgi:hypothetical protein
MVISTFKTLTRKHVPEKHTIHPDEEDDVSGSSDSLDSSSFQDDSSQDEAASLVSLSQQTNISQAESPFDQERCHSRQGRLEAKKDASDQLKAALPLLRHLISTMCLSLNPICLAQDPALHLQLILDILPQIDRRLDQIKRATALLYPRKENYPPRSDQHFQDYKSFRLNHFKLSLREFLWNEILELVHMSCESLEKAGFSRAHFLSRYTNGLRYRPWTPRPDILEEIDDILDGLRKSDFDLVQWRWPDCISDLDDILKECLNLIYRTTHTRQDELVIKIAKSLLPIVKLSRLLIRKLSTCCKKRFPFFIEIRSNQLKSLEHFPSRVVRSLKEFLRDLRRAFPPPPRLFDFTRSLEADHNTPLLLIFIQFLPFLSDTYTFPGQDSCKIWYTTWCDQFNLAVAILHDHATYNF